MSRMDTKTEEEEKTQTAGSGSRKWKGATSAFGLGLRVYLTALASTDNKFSSVFMPLSHNEFVCWHGNNAQHADPNPNAPHNNDRFAIQ